MGEKNKKKKRKKEKKEEKEKKKRKKNFSPPFEDSGLLFWAPDVRC